MPVAEDATLLTPDFLAKLKRLEMVSRRVFAGKMKGERRTRQRGTSVEFADYRNYVFGDEPRFVDWNTYGRLEKLFLKLFIEEEDLFLYLLVDTSKSMGFGNPEKLLQAKRIAAALAYISLLGMDRVSIATIASGLGRSLPPKRGRSQAREVFDFLGSLDADGTTSLAEATRRFSLQVRRSGIVIVLSDFLDKQGYETALKQLLHKRCEVYAIQVLDEDELNPRIAGDLRLVDMEDGSVAEVTVTERLLRNYRNVVTAYCEELQTFCIRRGIGYVLANTSTSFEDLVLRYLKTAGLLR